MYLDVTRPSCAPFLNHHDRSIKPIALHRPAERSREPGGLGRGGGGAQLVRGGRADLAGPRGAGNVDGISAGWHVRTRVRAAPRAGALHFSHVCESVGSE